MSAAAQCWRQHFCSSDQGPPLHPPRSLSEADGLSTRGQVGDQGRAYDLTSQDGRASEAESQSQIAAGGPVLDEYRRAPLCLVSSATLTTPLNGPCPEAEGDAGANDCGDDVPLEPLWHRSRTTETAPWSHWTQADAGGCPAGVLPILTVEDFRRFLAGPPVLHLQPDRGWVLVNKETIVSTERTEQTFRTELLGHASTSSPPRTRSPMTSVTTPTPSSRAAPGARGPTTTPSTSTSWARCRSRLTTSWKGRYRVDGTTQWRDVIGTAQTSATSPPFTVEERRSRRRVRPLHRHPPT